MGNDATTPEAQSRESQVICQNGQGVELRGTLLKLSRVQAIFEVYAPSGVLRLSEALSQFKILVQGRLVYSGRAVVTNLVQLHSAVVCEAALDEGGLDLKAASPAGESATLRASFEQFLRDCGANFRVRPEFKVAMADMQSLFLDLRLWMEQMDLTVRGQPDGSRAQHERDILQALFPSVLSAAAPLVERFEALANQVEPEQQAIHRAYMKRQIHPLVMCSPFLYRTFQKPLGYAGDYEMVNMMLRDPYEGGSLFAKMVNRVFLHTPPVIAHQNRIDYLVRHLNNEVRRVARRNKPLLVFNVGCGPAKEIQNFLAQEELSNRTNFTLLDFNEETLAYTTRVLRDLSAQHGRTTPVQMIKRSVHALLKDSGKAVAEPKYDLVYCAGLYDYLPEQVCRRLTSSFYDMLAPGGLLIVTNVSTANPSRNWMEYVLDWYLIYRSAAQFAKLAPERAPADMCSVQGIGDGVNIGLEVRKPDDAS